MRFFLLVAMSSLCLSAMDNNPNQEATMSCGDIALRYCFTIVLESIITRYTAAERQRLLAAASIQQDADQSNLQERTCSACCKRHWGKACCCCTCCCIAVGGGAIAFAGGITQGVNAIKNAHTGIAAVMQ